VLNFDRSTVKHALQNIQNDCHQWLSHSYRVHQIHFRPRLRPGPRWGTLQRSPRPSSWFKGDLLLRGRGKGEEEGKGKGSREKGKGEGMGGTAPLTQIPGSARDQEYGKYHAADYSPKTLHGKEHLFFITVKSVK